MLRKNDPDQFFILDEKDVLDIFKKSTNKLKIEKYYNLRHSFLVFYLDPNKKSILI